MSVIWLMMNPLYSSWNNALGYSRYPRGNTAPTVLPQMHYRYRGSTVHLVPSSRYYREILPIPTVITAVTAVLPHSPLPCHSLVPSLKIRWLMGQKLVSVWGRSLVRQAISKSKKYYTNLSDTMRVFCFAQSENSPPVQQCDIYLLTYYPTGTRVTNYPITAGTGSRPAQITLIKLLFINAIWPAFWGQGH